jgi:hypothetical protein
LARIHRGRPLFLYRSPEWGSEPPARPGSVRAPL